MDDQTTGAAPLGQEAAHEKRVRVFLLPEHEPLPEGFQEGDEVIRLVAATREMVEAERAAKMEAAKNAA